MARLLVAVLLGAVALVIVVRLLQPRFAFFPFSGETTTPREFGVDYEALTFTTRDGERLRAWHLRHATPRAVIVYFHGNGGNLSNWAPILAGVARQGYSVLAVDYRGYGLSTGRPSERGLYQDVDAVLEHVWSRAKPDGANPTVVYWGRSLGGAMAAYAATRHAPGGLILESSFPDARSLFRASPVMAFLALFSTYRFPAAEFMKGVTAPVLVLHGDADSIIPFEQGRALFERIGGPKQFFVIRGGDHNDAVPSDERGYWTAVNSFIGSVVH